MESGGVRGMDFLYIMIDGLGFDVLSSNKAPSLTQLGESSHIKRLETLLGYSCGIYSSIFTGLQQQDHGIWTEYYYSPHRQTCFSKALRLLPSERLRRIGKFGLSYALLQLSGRRVENPGVPVEVDSFFKKWRIDVTTLPFIKIPHVSSIIETMERLGHQWKYVYWKSLLQTEISEKRLDDLDDCSSLFILLGDMDTAGHRYGPFSEAYDLCLRRFDAKIGALVGKLLKRHPDLRVFVFSDHGMTSCTKRLNLERIVKQLGLRQPDDYLAFYNSTIANFWLFTRVAKRRMEDRLSKVAEGHVLQVDEVRRYGLDFAHNLYGDIFFVVKPGVRICPDYFNPTGIHGAGIHGYEPEDASTCAFMVGDQAYTKCLSNVVDIHQVFRKNLGSILEH